MGGQIDSLYSLPLFSSVPLSKRALLNVTSVSGKCWDLSSSLSFFFCSQGAGECKR